LTGNAHSQILAIMLVALVTLTLAKASISFTSSTTTTSTNECSNSIVAQLTTIDATLNETQALSLAQNSSAYQAASRNYTIAYNSWFDDFHFDNATCQITSTNIGESFVLETNNGPANIMEIFLDQQLTTVVTVLTFPYVVHSDHGQRSEIWSGYEMWWGSSPPYPAIYLAQMSYSLPTVTNPPLNPCINPLNFSIGCDLAIWTGLTDKLSGDPNFLAQTGSDEWLDSCLYGSCLYHNNVLWYQFLPNASVYCSGSASFGDKIVSYTRNEAANPGGDPNKYDVYTYDNTQGFGCIRPGVYYPRPTPIVAEFMAERAKGSYIGGTTYWTLAEFSTFMIHDGLMEYNGGLFSISQSYQNGFYQRDYMANGSPNYVNNTKVWNVICSGCFAEQWLSSSNT
jgi:hypothetical protein